MTRVPRRFFDKIIFSIIENLVMKKILPFITVFALISSPAFSQDTEKKDAPKKEHKEQDETPLGKEMEEMNDTFKKLRKESNAANGAKLARSAQENSLKCLTYSPDMLKGMPDNAGKAKAIASYRKMMGDVFVSLCALESAYLENKMEDAAKIIEELRDMKKAGHEKFIEE